MKLAGHFSIDLESAVRPTGSRETLLSANVGTEEHGKLDTQCSFHLSPSPLPVSRDSEFQLLSECEVAVEGNENTFAALGVAEGSFEEIFRTTRSKPFAEFSLKTDLQLHSPVTKKREVSGRVQIEPRKLLHPSLRFLKALEKPRNMDFIAASAVCAAASDNLSV